MNRRARRPAASRARRNERPGYGHRRAAANAPMTISYGAAWCTR